MTRRVSPRRRCNRQYGAIFTPDDPMRSARTRGFLNMDGSHHFHAAGPHLLRAGLPNSSGDDDTLYDLLRQQSVPIHIPRDGTRAPVGRRKTSTFGR